MLNLQPQDLGEIALSWLSLDSGVIEGVLTRPISSLEREEGLVCQVSGFSMWSLR